MYDAPGHRVKVVFPGMGEGEEEAIPSNSFAVVDNKVLLLVKTMQIDRFVRPESDEATQIQPGETCEGTLGGVHELALSGGLSGVEVGDKLWIDSEHNVLTSAVGTGTKNEVQEVQVKAKKGKVTLVFDGEETDEFAFNATAAEVKEALEALSNIDAGDITSVTGGVGDEAGTEPYVVTFGGQYAGTDVPALEAGAKDGEEPGEVIVTTKTGGAAGDTVFPLGVVDVIDATRTPHVARVNANALNAFIG